jgi:hypothetical protein
MTLWLSEAFFENFEGRGKNCLIWESNPGLSGCDPKVLTGRLRCLMVTRAVSEI